MIAARIDFGPLLSLEAPEREAQVESAEHLLSLLRSNGNFGEGHVLSEEGGHHIAYVRLTRADSFAERPETPWLTAGLSEVEVAFGTPPTVRLLDDTPEAVQLADWQGAGSLLLFTTFLDTGSPILRGDDGYEVAVFLLPVSERIRHDISSWAWEYRSLDAVWMASGELEIPAYKQLVEIGSPLNQSGRDLARVIENATTLPTYVYVMRCWGRHNETVSRVCPSCGGPWFVEQFDEDGIAGYPFRCDPCRLVSHMPGDTTDERHARLGEYRPPR